MINVRLIIVCHPDDIYEASVITTDSLQSWFRTYNSKEDCMYSLCEDGLLTLDQADQALIDPFDLKEKLLAIYTKADPGDLVRVGFIPREPDLGRVHTI